MRNVLHCLCLLALPSVAFGQEINNTQPPPPPPPIVNAPDAPKNAPVPTGGDQMATPPPPGGQLPQGGLGPGQYGPGQSTGYQPYYGMPYNQPGAKPKGPEIGLMFTEGAYGLLAAGAEVLLPGLLMSVLGIGPGSAPPLGDIILVGLLIAEPLAVSQTILSVANGSHYYYSESWPAMLAGLGAEGAVVGLYFALRGSNPGNTVCTDPSGNCGIQISNSTLAVLITSVIVVPIVEVVVLNLTKQPRASMFGAVNYSHERGWSASLPMPSPILTPTSQGLSAGVSFPLLAGRF